MFFGEITSYLAMFSVLKNPYYYLGNNELRLRIHSLNTSCRILSGVTYISEMNCVHLKK